MRLCLLCTMYNVHGCMYAAKYRPRIIYTVASLLDLNLRHQRIHIHNNNNNRSILIRLLCILVGCCVVLCVAFSIFSILITNDLANDRRQLSCQLSIMQKMWPFARNYNNFSVLNWYRWYWFSSIKLPLCVFTASLSSAQTSLVSALDPALFGSFKMPLHIEYSECDSQNLRSFL